MITPEQRELIQRSFDAIWPVRRGFADLFYARFFELCPKASSLFHLDDLERQQLKLMDMIAAIVGALDQHDLFHSLIRHTGRNHAQFGVQSSHFDAFGDALMISLERQFGTDCTPDLQIAWRSLYASVCREMLGIRESSRPNEAGKIFPEATTAR